MAICTRYGRTKRRRCLKNMEYKTRRHVQHAIEMGVKTITLDISEIDRFYQLFKMAEERHHFKYRQIHINF